MFPCTLRQWCKHAERDAGDRPGRSIADKVRIKELERENKELRTANEILKKASAYVVRRSSTARSANDFLHRRVPRGLRSRSGLPRSAALRQPAARAAVARNLGKASGRSRRDAETLETIKRVRDESKGRCRVRKIWRQLRREKSEVARRTME